MGAARNLKIEDLIRPKAQPLRNSGAQGVRAMVEGQTNFG